MQTERTPVPALRKCRCVRQPNRSLRHLRAVVYFVRVGNLVKVGTTTAENWKLHHGELLGIMRGHYDVEKWVLYRFHHLLHYRKEWFVADPELLAFVEAHTQPLTERYDLRPLSLPGPEA